jgi:hypothetical protein
MADFDDVEPLLGEAHERVRDLYGSRLLAPEVVLRIDRDLSKISKVLTEETSARQRQRKTLAARKRLAKDVDELVKIAKRSPKYSTIEFKCLDDYEKCREHRSKYDLFCLLSYLICILRRLIPLASLAQ